MQSNLYETDFYARDDHPTYLIAFDDEQNTRMCLLEAIGKRESDLHGANVSMFLIATNSHLTAKSTEAATKTLNQFFLDHGLGVISSGWSASSCVSGKTS